MLPLTTQQESSHARRLVVVVAAGGARVVSNSNNTTTTTATSSSEEQQQQRKETASSRLDDDASSLLPHREPGFHTIKRTFNQFLQREAKQQLQQPSEVDDYDYAKKPRLARKRPSPGFHHHHNQRQQQQQQYRQLQHRSDASGSEGGYAGSASSSEGHFASSSSSSSVSSSDDASVDEQQRQRSTFSGDPKRLMLRIKKHMPSSSSSEIADFGTSCSESAAESLIFLDDDSPSIASSDNNDCGANDASVISPSASVPVVDYHYSYCCMDSKPAAKPSKAAPIMSVGCDVMAHVLTFLEPPDVLDVLTAPLSKEWLSSFTRQPELWRVLCLLDPFKAKVEHDSDDKSDSLLNPFDVESNLRRTFGKYRLVYTSFVRCMRYLAHIKQQAASGSVPPTATTKQNQKRQQQQQQLPPSHNLAANHNLQLFLARARGVVGGRRAVAQSDISDDDDEDDNNNNDRNEQVVPVAAAGIAVSDDGSRSSASPRKRKAAASSSANNKNNNNKKIKFAHSKITQRLLGPTSAGEPGEVELPWSCAIYSIVNWMMAFANVEGIQTMCLKVLPLILENEQQRMTAQRAGLTEMVLRSMVIFADSATLHTAAFHTIVLLARPLGGQEGMLFHSSMVNNSGIFADKSSSSSSQQTNGKNGIAVMLDSMKRFAANEVLQAMSCWSLVNIALAPTQKEVLVKLGGIQATANAMMEHPYNAEVQVRYI